MENQNNFTNQREFFSKNRSLIKIENMLTFLSLEEIINMTRVNSLMRKYIKDWRKIEAIKKVKQKYLKSPIFNLNQLEMIIKNEDKEIQEILKEFFGIYTCKYIFPRQIQFNEISENFVENLMKCYQMTNYETNVGVIQLTDNNFSEEILNLVLNSFLTIKPIQSLMNLTITNSRLTDDCLYPIENYIKKFTLKTLVLNGNEIGLTYKSQNFLKTLRDSESVEWVSLDLCHFSSNSLDLLKEIHISPTNKIKSLTLFYNSFSLKDIENLFNSNLISQKTLGISFRYSPDYLLSSMRREVLFSNNFFLNRCDENEFYDIYFKDLNFEFLGIWYIDVSIVYVIDRIISQNSNLVEMNVNFNLINRFCATILRKILDKGQGRIQVREEMINNRLVINGF